MTHLEVTANLGSPVVLPSTKFPLMLDSLLAWAALKVLPTFGIDVDPAETDQLILPLQKIVDPTQIDDWYWACTMGTLKGVGEEYIDYFHAVKDWQDFSLCHPQPKKIAEASKQWKSSRKPRVCTPISKICWRCDTTDENVLMNFLKNNIFNLGKDWSRGGGKVLNWESKKLDEPFTLDHHDRPIPSSHGENFESIRPPYWSPTQKRLTI